MITECVKKRCNRAIFVNMDKDIDSRVSDCLDEPNYLLWVLMCKNNVSDHRHTEERLMLSAFCYKTRNLDHICVKVRYFIVTFALYNWNKLFIYLITYRRADEPRLNVDKAG